MNLKKILLIQEQNCESSKVLKEFFDSSYQVKTMYEIDGCSEWIAENKPFLIVVCDHHELQAIDVVKELYQDVYEISRILVILQTYDNGRYSELLKMGLKHILIDGANFKVALSSYVELLEIESKKSFDLYNLQESIDELDSFNKQLVTSIHDGVIVYDTEMKYRYWNEYMEQISGYKSVDILGKDPRDLFPFLEENGVIEVIKGALVGKVTTSKEFPYTIPDKNKSGWAFDSTGPLFDTKNNIIGAITSVRDITERKQLEDELKLSESKYRTIIEGSNDMIWTLDREGRFEFINTVAQKETGIKLDTCKGQSFISYVLQEDLPMLMDIFNRTMAGEVCKYELRLRKENGQLLYIKTSTAPMIENEEIVGVVSFGVNYTDNYEKENRIRILNTAIEQSPVSVVMTDKNGTIEYANRKFLELTEYELDEVIGQNPRVLKSGSQSNEFYHQMWSTILDGKDWHGEFHNKTKNGRSYWENVVISPIKNKSGGIEHFIAIKEDITSLKNLNLQLEESLQKAEETDRLKTAFLQNMSHEIRTPMNSIIGFSNLLAKSPLNEERIEKYTTAIEKSTNELLGKINDLLIISSLETGQEVVNNEHANIGQLLDNVYRYFKRYEMSGNLDFRLKVSDHVKELDVSFDHQKIEVVLKHLIDNAFKFTNSGEIEFGCSVAKEDEQQGHIVLEFYVKDTGIGIDEKWHKRIFERFLQEDNSVSRKYEGNGIGLAICKGYVEILGGEIRLESRRNEGTVFYFTVVCDVIQKQMPEEVLAIQGVPKILIAEDEFYNFLLLKEILSHFDVEVIHAKNGVEAVELAREIPDLDIILMDIKMPEKDGFAATEEIKEFNSKIPIIAQTAYTMDAELIKLKDIFDSYIQKPINIDAFQKVIGKYLNIVPVEE